MTDCMSAQVLVASFLKGECYIAKRFPFNHFLLLFRGACGNEFQFQFQFQFQYPSFRVSIADKDRVTQNSSPSISVFRPGHH